MKYTPRTLVSAAPDLGLLQIGIKSQGYRETRIALSAALHSHLQLSPDNYDNEPSDDDNDDDDVEKDEEDGEEEEHLALVDPSAVPTDDPACITEFAATLPSSSPPPENVEDNIRETMTIIDQGMSVEEIERVVAKRVANAIELFAIYEMKTTWPGENCKKVGHMTQECRNPMLLGINENHTSMWKYKSEKKRYEERTNSSSLSRSISWDLAGLPAESTWSFKLIFPHLGARSCLSRRRMDHSGCALTIGIKQTDSEEPLSLPIMDDLFDQLQGSTCLLEESTLRSGYHQLMGSREEVIQRLPSRTRYDHYEISSYAVWFDKRTCRIHGFYESEQEGTWNEPTLKQILEFLKREELFPSFKCKFWIPKVQFLGHVIDSEGIHVDPAKIESIKDWTSLMHQSLHYLKEAKISSHTAMLEERELDSGVRSHSSGDYYLYGTSVQVFTDHKSSAYILESKRVEHWRIAVHGLELRTTVMKFEDLSHDISLDLPKQILNAQTEVRKQRTLKVKSLGDVD
ncbi:hypothetical protein Tco_1538876 [Tanacetum coccineum]